MIFCVENFKQITQVFLLLLSYASCSEQHMLRSDWKKHGLGLGAGAGVVSPPLGGGLVSRVLLWSEWAERQDLTAAAGPPARQFLPQQDPLNLKKVL